MNKTSLRSAIEESVAANWFCTMATTSRANHPHVAGVLYALVGRDLYVNTDESSRKARNVADTGRAAVCVAIDGPAGAPPSTICFQGTAALVANDDGDIQRLVASGQLAAITSHGEPDRPGTCMIRITPTGRMFTYGIGITFEELQADALNAAGSAAW